MEKRNNRLWIIIVGVLILLCCCVVAAGAAAVGWFTAVPVVRQEVGLGEFAQETVERTLETGQTPELTIDNFAGPVRIQAGEGSTIHVMATKRVRGLGDLDRIEVLLEQQGDRVSVRTKKPTGLSTASVELVITAPTDTQLDVETGAGEVDIAYLRSDIRVHTGAGSISLNGAQGDIELDSGSGSVHVDDTRGNLVIDTGSGSITLQDVSGTIDAHSGAGSIDVRNAQATVRLDTGTGGIDFTGDPQGECRFESGAGSITLTLPPDLHVAVNLDTGAGSIDLGYELSESHTATRSKVKGVIGTGADGSIYAHTGTGSIDMRRR